MWWLGNFWSLIWFLFWFVLVYCQADLVHVSICPCSWVSSGLLTLFHTSSISALPLVLLRPPPTPPIQSYSITSHYWIQEAGCHISIHAKMSPMSPVGRLSLQNKTCCCWHGRCSVQTRLSLLLSFSTLHIYFVPFHCADGQSWCFQCSRSQEWLPQKDSLKDPFLQLEFFQLNIYIA